MPLGGRILTCIKIPVQLAALPICQPYNSHIFGLERTARLRWLAGGDAGATCPQGEPSRIGSDELYRGKIVTDPPWVTGQQRHGGYGGMGADIEVG